MPSSKDSNTDPARKRRRFLIAAGTAQYPHLKNMDLPSVTEDVRLAVECFQKLGYEQVLPELAINPTHSDLEDKLRRWFADEARSSDDKVVFYYSGHGKRMYDRLYLLTSDTQIPKSTGTIFTDTDEIYTGTAYESHKLVQCILESSRIQQGMIILDVCFAGGGVADIADDLSRWGNWRSNYSFVLIAAARTREYAYPGFFAKAFTDAIAEQRLGGGNQEWLPTAGLVQTVIKTVNSSIGDMSIREMIAPEEWQHATWSFAPPQVGDLPNLFPNLRYDPCLPVGVDLDAQRYHRDLLEHWLPRARGVEAKSEAWYFTGREVVLRQIVAWLTAPSSAGKALVVTGSVGTGKSAILARLVILSNPDYRDRIEAAGYLDGISEDTLPPKSIVNLAVHARRKTLHGIVEAIVEGVNVKAQDADELVEVLKNRTERLVIVVDALDEADQSQAITRFLSRLTGNPHLWLLVGSRPNTPPGTHGPRVRNLGSVTTEMNLDDFPEITQQDIATYAFRRLLAKGEHRATPYQGQPEQRVHAVARSIANKAKRVFLIARIICEDLIKAKEPVDVSVPDWDKQFPSSIGEAFSVYLKRFDELQAIGLSQRKVTDLLRPLAYAEGEGLPWESVWRPLADAIAARTESRLRHYEDTDIERMLEHAGAFVVESEENGRSAYRLYHQALAEYLREGGTSLTEIQSGIASTLIDLVPERDGRRDWISPATHPYIRMHLASHAGAAGLLDILVLDPGYLAVADPIRLVPALKTLADVKAREVADVYRRIAYELPAADPLERMALIHLTACQEAPKLAPALEPPIPTTWRCRWAHWMPSTPHRIVGRHESSVNAVALGEVDGAPVVVSGGKNRTVRLWDARTGQPRGESLTGHTDGVEAVALGEVDGAPVVVSGSGDKTVRLWDARTGRPIGEPLTGHTNSVAAVALGEVDGAPVVVSGSLDNTVRLWDARTGRPISEPLIGHPKPVVAVALGEVDGAPVLVSGSWDKTVRLWDARTGRPRGEPLTGHTDIVAAVALGEVDGAPVVVSGSWDNTVRLWDARTGQPIGEPLIGHLNPVLAVALGDIDGEPVVVSGSWDSTVRLWDARTDRPRGEPLTGHTDIVAAALGEVDGAPVVVSGSWDTTVRLWDARTGQPIGEPLIGHLNPVVAVALGEVDGAPVVVSGSWDNTVRLWDARTGRPRGEPLTGHTYIVAAVALGEVDGAPVVVSGSWDKTVRLWDARTGRPRGEPLTGHTGAVLAVALGDIDGEPVVVSGSWDSTVRLWDAHSYDVLRVVPLRSGVTGVAMGRDSAAAVSTRRGLLVLDFFCSSAKRISSARAHEFSQ